MLIVNCMQNVLHMHWKGTYCSGPSLGPRPSPWQMVIVGDLLGPINKASLWLRHWKKMAVQKGKSWGDGCSVNGGIWRTIHTNKACVNGKQALCAQGGDGFSYFQPLPPPFDLSKWIERIVLPLSISKKLEWEQKWKPWWSLKFTTPNTSHNHGGMSQNSFSHMLNFCSKFEWICPGPCNRGKQFFQLGVFVLGLVLKIVPTTGLEPCSEA